MDLIITIMATDKPGIVDKIAKVVNDNQGNWVDSRLAHMAGRFTGIVKIQCPSELLTQMQAALQKLRDDGIQIVCELGQEPAEDSSIVVDVEITAHDRPGIIAQVSAALVNQGANILRLHSGVHPAPMASEMMFIAQIEFSVNNSDQENDAIEAIEAISDEIMVDRLVGQVKS